jgi:pentatricopeptide repeat protein
LHADARKEGLASHVFVGNSLMTLYAKTGAIERAEHVFATLASCGNVVSWNVMLSAYVEQGQAERALLLYARMHEEGKMLPDPQTFASIFQACSMPKEDNSAGVKKDRWNQLPLVVIGRALHSDARKRGFASHLFVGNSILSMYGRFGELAEARAAFEELHQPTVVSWNALLSSYVEHGKADEALALYKRMQDEGEGGGEGLLPNDVTLVCALQAAGDAGARELCYQIHFAALSAGFDSSCFVATTLIHAYGNSANVADLESVFCQMLCPGVEPWNARLTAFAAEGDRAATATSLEAFEEMICTGIRPSKVSIFALLCACSYTGLVEKGLECFVSMNARDLGFSPELKHYVIAVDVLGRAGDFGKVEKLLSEMPLQPDLALWLCLLGACRIHGNVELGEHAYDRALRVQPDEAALYVSMSNIYARW